MDVSVKLETLAMLKNNILFSCDKGLKVSYMADNLCCSVFFVSYTFSSLTPSLHINNW